MVNKHDELSFFITYVIVDFTKNKMTYIFTYNDDNVKILQEKNDSDKYKMIKCPHCAIYDDRDESILVFNEDENFFAKIFMQNDEIHIYELKDLNGLNDQNWKLSHTFYKDYENPNYFIMSAVNSENILHIIRVSLNLDEIQILFKLEGKPIPPHVIKNYQKFLFLSDEFRYSQFELRKKDKIVTQNEFGRLYYKMTTKVNVQNDDKLDFSNRRKILLKKLTDELDVKCLNGRILAVNKLTGEKKYYQTTGGSPAHFEVDEKNGCVYTSAHNFFSVQDGVLYLEPAVIDKFKISDNELIHEGRFTTPAGYRFTSHRIFEIEGNTYLCTFGQPNRLFIVDTNNMELFHHEDINGDELSGKDLYQYINTREGDFEIIALEVSKDGRYIMFIGSQYIYIYDFIERQICKKIAHYFETELDVSMKDYVIRTVHINYLN